MKTKKQKYWVPNNVIVTRGNFYQEYYIIKDKRIYYFDITAYMQDKENKSGITTVVLRRYAASDILQLIDDLQVAFVTTSVTYTEKFGNITIGDVTRIIDMLLGKS